MTFDYRGRYNELPDCQKKVVDSLVNCLASHPETDLHLTLVEWFRRAGVEAQLWWNTGKSVMPPLHKDDKERS
jgi:hypothetical protein